jgi:hypothetical protein
MEIRIMSRPLAAILSAAAIGILAPGAYGAGLDMGSLWPNGDGTAWTYEQHWEVIFPETYGGDNVVRLILDGTTVAPNGIDAQVLRGEVVSGSTSSLAMHANAAGPLHGYLWQARPDLRPVLEAQAQAAGTLPCPEDAPQGFQGIYLSGDYAFQKTAGEIAAWRCNVADTRSWIWLVSSLSIGNTFTLQLVPDLADNVFLHGTIAAVEDVTVPAGTFGSCLRVDYVVDYGTVECTDQNGNPVGTSRAETRGYVHYAPGTGPIQSFEEFIPYVEATGTCVPPGDAGRVASRVSMKLTSGPVPVVPATWGQVKAGYRH